MRSSLLPLLTLSALLLAAPASAIQVEPVPGTVIYVLDSEGSGTTNTAFTVTRTGVSSGPVEVFVGDMTQSSSDCEAESTRSYFVDTTLGGALVGVYQVRDPSGCSSGGSDAGAFAVSCGSATCNIVLVADRSTSASGPAASGESEVVVYNVLFPTFHLSQFTLDRTNANGDGEGTLGLLVQGLDYEVHVGPTPGCAGLAGGVVYASETHYGPLTGNNGVCL